MNPAAGIDVAPASRERCPESSDNEKIRPAGYAGQSCAKLRASRLATCSHRASSGRLPCVGREQREKSERSLFTDVLNLEADADRALAVRGSDLEAVDVRRPPEDLDGVTVALLAIATRARQLGTDCARDPLRRARCLAGCGVTGAHLGQRRPIRRVVAHERTSDGGTLLYGG